MTLRCEVNTDGVGILTIARPQRRNALDSATMRLLADTIQALTTDSRVRVLIVTGAGEDAFCSGGDLEDLSGRLSADDATQMIELMGETLLRLERLPYPVIAAINGYALGGGSELALACDIRVVDQRARLGFIHLRRGLIPGWGGGQRLLRLVGYARALELLMRAQPLHADEIVSLGLAMTVTPPGETLAGALTLARQIVTLDQAAVVAAKQMLQAGLNLPYEAALARERSLFPSLWTGETHLAAMRAFTERENGG